MSDDLEFIVIDDIPEYIFCIGDDEENEQVIALSGKDGAFKYEKVAELPTTGEDGVLYLVPKSHTTQTASGNPINVNITDNAGKIESLKLDGDTFQQTYTGKNLLNYNTIVQTTLNGVTLSLADDGTITLNGTCSSDNTRFGFDGLSLALDGTYTLSSEVISGTITNATDMTKIRLFKSGYSGGIRVDLANTSASSTSSASGDYILNDIRIDNGVVLTNYKIKIQLEKSATATSFEPYVGGQPSPSPDYPQQIQTVTGEQVVEVKGKNLFDKNHPNNSQCFVSDNGVLMDGGQNRSVYIECEPNTTYTVSKSNKGTNNRFCVFNTEAKPAIGVSVISTVGTRVGENNSSSYTITTGANAHYLGVYYRAGSTTPSESEIRDTIQIEKGSTATAYAPYTKQTLPINLGSIELCKLGTYQDYIYKDGDDWKVHKATVSAIIDGSESWDTSGTNTFYVANIYSKIGNSIQSASTGEMYASHFTIVDITSSNTLVGASLRVDAAHNVSNLRIRLQDMSGGVAGFRQMLSAKKPSIYARRLTPTDTTITDTTLITQLEAIRTAALESGSNTISNTATGTNLAGDLEIGYYGYDPLNKYDKYFWLDVDGGYESL